MDFQNYIDGFHSSTCVVSIEKRSDGGYGDVRIVGKQTFYFLV